MAASRRILSAALVIVAGPLAAQERTVTLRDAVELALRTQPQMVQARGNISIASSAKRQIIGSWLPSLSASSGATQSSSTRFNQATGENVNVAQPWSYSAGFSSSLLLFDGFQRFAQARAAGADITSSEVALVVQKFAITLQTKQTFFDALASDDLVRVAEASVRRAEEQLKISKDKLAAGGAIRSDTLRAKVEVGRAQLQLLNAQTQRATAEANLARLVGVDGSVRAVGDSTIAPVTQIDTAALRTEALRSAPTLEQAEAESNAASAQVAAGRAEYFPRITTSFSNTLSGTDIGALSSGWNLRFSLSWNLFNGFSREATQTRNSVSRDVAFAQIEDTRRQVNAQLTQQLASLETARAQLGISQASRAAAAEDLRVQQERYRLGVATIVEVLISQVSLDQAEVDMIQARFDALVAQAQIEAIIGRELK